MDLSSRSLKNKHFFKQSKKLDLSFGSLKIRPTFFIPNKRFTFLKLSNYSITLFKPKKLDLIIYFIFQDLKTQKLQGSLLLLERKEIVLNGYGEDLVNL